MDTLLLIIILFGIFLIYIAKNNKKDIENFTEYININKYITTYDWENKKNYSNRRINQKHDNEYRDEGTCGIDRTTKNKKWYHVANRLVDDDEQLYTKSKYDYRNKIKKRKCKNNKNNKNNKNSKIRCDSQNVCNQDEKNCKIKDIVFNDYYEGGSFNDLLKTDDSIDLDKTDKTNFDKVDDDFCEERDNEKLTTMDGTLCNVKQQTKDLKKYLREVVLDGRDQCFCANDKTKAEFTRTDADNYRESQIRFRNKIWESSAPVADPVDKENEIRLQGGFVGKGETIADVHDSLVHNKSTINGKNNNVKFVNHVNDRDILGKMMMTGFGNYQMRSNLDCNDLKADMALGNHLPLQPDLAGNGIVGINGTHTRHNKPFRLNLETSYDSPMNGGIRHDGILGTNDNLMNNDNLLI